MEFPDALTERCAALQLLEAGFHHAHISVGNTFGSPEAMRSFEAFHAEAVNRGLAPKAALIGISRGCLYAHRFAAKHPDTVVPPEGNALLVEQRYRKLGGAVKVIHKPGVDHHPHGLEDPTPVVDFILDSAA